MKKIIMLLMIAGISIGGVSAQHTRGIAGLLKFGYTYLPGSGSTLNTISTQGLNAFSNDFTSFDLEGIYKTNKIVLALDGNIGTQGAKLPQLIPGKPTSFVPICFQSTEPLHISC
ncbi:MAG: hypothetical protein JWP81_1114 [Ferruginibacter sp.]|nr:hypothetical protein [Ferruginibacter sp.]